MTEDRVREYMAKGGKLFRVRDIDVLRDGGTTVIELTTNETYYINKDNKTLHYRYETSDSNMITDELLKEYILDRVKCYIDITEQALNRTKNLLNEINGDNLKQKRPRIKT
jgi:hypothetical protein